jgi:hypothetical protein
MTNKAFSLGRHIAAACVAIANTSAEAQSVLANAMSAYTKAPTLSAKAGDV